MRKSKNHLAIVTVKPHGFYELAKAHVATHGGEWFVVDKREMAHQWRAWIAYFAWLDDQNFPRGGKAVTFGRMDSVTVPTAWPLEFDANAPPAALPEPREALPALERRRELGEMLRQLVDKWGAEPRHRSADVRNVPQKAAPADYTCSAPLVNTAKFANYLNTMREENPVEF